MAKGGSKVITAVIAFLLGFIFAILVQLGAIFGVVFFVTNADLDTIFNTIGIRNKDDDGNYIYINTDSNNGGAKNLAELIALLRGYLSSDGSSMDYPVLGKSVGDISELLPIIQKTLADKLYPVINGYADVDWEKFESTSLSELPQFLNEVMMDIRPAVLLSKMGMNGLVGDDANPLVNALLAGAEYEYAYTESELKFPVYYDNYVYNETLNEYFRDEAVEGQQAYPSNLDKELLYDSETHNEGGDRIYRLYFIPCTFNGGEISDPVLSDSEETIYSEDTTFFAVRYDEEEDKYVLDTSNDFIYLKEYGLHNIDRTGNFYYDNEGNELQIYPVTFRSFSDPDEVFKPLYCTRITEIMDGDIIPALFGRHSVGELLDDKIDIDECVNDLPLVDVITIDPEESMMAYIGFGLTNVKAVEGEDDLYTARIDIDGVPTSCFVSSKLKGEPARRTVARVWYVVEGENGEPVEIDVPGTKVKEVSGMATSMEMNALLDVKASDAIMCYIGYGLFNVIPEKGKGYTHVGKCDVVTEEGTVEKDVFIATDKNGIITDVWYPDGEQTVRVGGTKVNKVSTRITELTNRLALPDVIDIKADQKITVYIGYGITGVNKVEDAEGLDYTHTGSYTPAGADEPVTCYMATDENGKITSAWYMVDGAKKYIVGTPIKKTPEKIETISEDLTLADVMNISKDDKILWALRDSKINKIGENVGKLKINQVLKDEDIKKSAILRQLANKTIDDLATAIDEIPIQSIYIKEIYGLESDLELPKKVEESDEYQEDVLYFTYDAEKDEYRYVNPKPADPEEAEGYNEDTYGVLTKEQFDAMRSQGLYTYGKAKGMWKLVLMKKDNGGIKREKVYTLNNLHNMILTCAANIGNASLKDLKEAGIISTSDDDLGRTVVWNGGSKELGLMSLEELITAVLNPLP